MMLNQENCFLHFFQFSGVSEAKIINSFDTTPTTAAALATTALATTPTTTAALATTPTTASTQHQQQQHWQLHQQQLRHNNNNSIGNNTGYCCCYFKVVWEYDDKLLQFISSLIKNDLNIESNLKFIFPFLLILQIFCFTSKIIFLEATLINDC